MNVPETYSELQDAVKHMEGEDGEELCANPHCEALREILDAADKLERNCDEAMVDAAFQAVRQTYGMSASKDEYLIYLCDHWMSYSDLEEYAMDMADAMSTEIPDFLKNHIDWESVGNELIAEEDVFTFYDGNLYIFRG